MNGKKLLAMIEDSGYTQRQFAGMVGVTPSAISAIIAETQQPSLALAKLMADRLGTTVDELVRE